MPYRPMNDTLAEALRQIQRLRAALEDSQRFARIAFDREWDAVMLLRDHDLLLKDYVRCTAETTTPTGTLRCILPESHAVNQTPGKYSHVAISDDYEAIPFA